MINKCSICGRENNDGTLASEDCGGDCLKCMADIGEDPDCQRALYGKAEEDQCA